MKKIKNRIITLAVAGLSVACGTGIGAVANEMIKTAYVEDGVVYTDETKTEVADHFYADDNGEIYIDPEMTVAVPHKDKSEYEVNENGETFGTGADAMYPEDEPDLIAAVGDNGIEGYVRKTELDDDEMDKAQTPEEVARIQEERDAKGNPNRIINVYESDGVTVIDTFTIGSRTIKNNN